MRSIRVSRFALLTLVASCVGSQEPVTIPVAPSDAGAPDAAVIPTDAGPPADAGMSRDCVPELLLTPRQSWVLPSEYLRLYASGGTGAYRFALANTDSGASLDAETGRYHAGEILASSDVVILTDEGCDGEARVTITTYGDAFSIAPKQVTVAPGTRFQFETIGGSGTAVLRLVRRETGGTLRADGSYLAGGTEGTDIVEASDPHARVTALATVTVVHGAKLVPRPAIVFVPVGQQLRLRVDGGSGYFRFNPPAPEVELTGDVLTGLAPGRHDLVLEDVFTAATATITIGVVASPSFPAVRSGDATLTTTILGPGDLNGDGYPDAVMAHPEADIAAWNGGAVFVYAGEPGTLTSTPAQTIAGINRSDELGRSAVIADFDGDGELDLAVGAPRAEVDTGFDIGTVNIYRGRPGAFFSAGPDEILAGRIGGDLFGWSVAACDFDGDGRIDLAVGAYNAEDRTRERADWAFDQGGVFIYHRGEDGFGDEPTTELWGDVPAGDGAWVGDPAMHLGTNLAAADFDGDGVCDLAVSTYEFDLVSGNSNDGLVYLYKGVRGTGLRTRPSIAWASSDPEDDNGRFGRGLTAGDLDGDGKAELAVGHYLHDAGQGDNHGALYLFRGRDLPLSLTATAYRSPSTADWSYVHDGSWDQIGFYPVIADATGDGLPDLLVGNLSDEVAGRPWDSGTIRIYEGRAQSGLLPATTPTRIIPGRASGDYYGTSLGVIGDVDNDGIPEILGFSGLSDRHGRDVGSVELLLDYEPETFLSLALPGGLSGNWFGWAADIVGDVDGDGFADLIVGAPYSASATRGMRTGAAYLYRGLAEGFEDTPSIAFEGSIAQTAWDFVGWSVSRAGDFDRDGADDFAIVARYDDKAASANYPEDTFALEAACPSGTRNNVGAVYVFRGSSSGLPSAEPAFILYGPDPNDSLRQVTGGFDYNGDGYDDIAFGSLEWDRPGANNSGGLALVAGRQADPGGRITVVCGQDFVLRGINANDYLGISLAGIGDVDGDGCDEVAAGAPLADFGLSNQGAIRIVFGWGGRGCPSSPMMTTLRSGVANAQGGYSLGGGGHDVDGDGKPDLASGLVGYNALGYGEGAAAVISGAYIAQLPRELAQDVTAPVEVASFFDDYGQSIRINGTVRNGRFGDSVALISTATRSGIIVGIPDGRVAGAPLTGGAKVYFYDAATRGFELGAVLGGETQRAGGRVGEWVQAGPPGVAVGVVGGYYGSAGGLDIGSVYLLDLR